MNLQAGAFTPFTTTMSREDGNQNLEAVELHMPQGLSGLLTGVELCPEAQANAGTCSANSLIGETIVSVGLGSTPYTVTGGRVYITGPYEGAPFGLSIVNPAKAGPFDLGQVVGRAKIEVDHTTAALTVSTDRKGPYAIPQFIKGIPLQIKHVNVTINRPGFTFNPTNCQAMRITGELASVNGAASQLAVPFQVTNCATLKFAPGFAVSTSGSTSRMRGASLHVRLTYPKAPFGSQANIRAVKVDLPKRLPSRLTTLQKACPDSTFEADHAACSAQSRVGSAVATTPLLPVPLRGPAYFVSHGGAKFPELVVVLQGYGVTLELHGETFINKAGITKLDVPYRTGRTRGNVRTHAPTRTLFRVGGQREPLRSKENDSCGAQGQDRDQRPQGDRHPQGARRTRGVADADNVRRAERSHDQTRHTNQRYRLHHTPHQPEENQKIETTG